MDLKFIVNEYDSSTQLLNRTKWVEPLTPPESTVGSLDSPDNCKAPTNLVPQGPPRLHLSSPVHLQNITFQENTTKMAMQTVTSSPSYPYGAYVTQSVCSTGPKVSHENYPLLSRQVPLMVPPLELTQRQSSWPLGPQCPNAFNTTEKSSALPSRRPSIPIISNNKIGSVVINAETRSYCCKTCGRSFVRKSGLIRHERIHSGVRPNKCNLCNKKFLQRSALTVHYRVHTGEKPYSCKVCHRPFSDSSSLARHRRIHLRDNSTKRS